MNWIYIILGMVIWQMIKIMAIVINQAVIDRRHQKFLKLVNVVFPDQEQITFISLDTSDKRAMAKLERQLRDQFDSPEQADEIRLGDR